MKEITKELAQALANKAKTLNYIKSVKELAKPKSEPKRS